MLSDQLQLTFEKMLKEKENNRAFRIALRMKDNNILMANIYENLVDRDFNLAQKDIQILIGDLRSILKSIPEDDF